MKRMRVPTELWSQIDRLREGLTKHKRKDKRFDIADIAAGLTLPDDDEFVTGVFYREKIRLIKRFDRALRPQRLQPDLFAATAWIPLGSNERVLLGDSTREQIQQWGAIEAANHAAQNSAYARKARFVADVVGAWARPEFRDVHHAKELWQLAFGWTERVDPMPLIDPYDDEDDED